MVTSLPDLAPAPENTKWVLTVIDGDGSYQARLVSKLTWETLAHGIIDGNMSKYKAHKKTQNMIDTIGAHLF